MIGLRLRVAARGLLLLLSRSANTGVKSKIVCCLPPVLSCYVYSSLSVQSEFAFQNVSHTLTCAACAPPRTLATTAAAASEAIL
jgi:hypothetical protein